MPKHRALVIDAVNVILRQLDGAPHSSELEALALRQRGLACIEQTKDWKDQPPSAEQHDAVMKAVLALHLTVRKREPLT